MALPILYSFRRCPYAIRARLALRQAGVTVELCEVSLRNKPAAMLALSPKGTVPVLQLPDGTVLDQSLDVMLWALGQHDADGWLAACQSGGEGVAAGVLSASVQALIARNDGPFKLLLDRYKYANRHPEFPAAHYRDEAVALHLAPLDALLAQADAMSLGKAGGAGAADAADPLCVPGPGLLGPRMTLVDAAIFPFVRQFAAVDADWFTTAPLPALRAWLQRWLDSALLRAVMEKAVVGEG